jgi:tetratricopeptide (TPR) repeat protein
MRLIPWILLPLACMVIYGRAAQFNVTGLDDDTLIGSFAGHHYSLLEAVSSNAFMIHKGNDFYRPLQSMFFILDAAASGARPTSWHITNIALHCLAAISLLWLLLLLGYDRYLAFFAAAFFVLNPQLAQAVAWVPGQGDVLLGLFGILSLASLILFRRSGNYWFFALHGAAFFLAAMSKESAVLLPGLFAAFLLLREGKKSFCRSNLLLVPLWLGIAAAYLALRHGAMAGLPKSNIFGLEPFIGNLRVLPETLGGFFAGYDIPVMPSFTPAATGIGCAFAVALAVVLMVQRKLGRPMVLFGIAWFIALSVPGMMYCHELGSHAYDYLNHRSYLPLLGIVLLLAEAVPSAWYSLRARGAIIAAGTVAALAVATLLWRQIGYFADPPAFYNQAIRTNPESALALNNRGKLRSDGGDLKGSLTDFDAAIRLLPNYSMAYNNRGALLGQMGDFDHAAADFQKSIELDPLFSEAMLNLGLVLIRRNDRTGACALWHRAAELGNERVQGFLQQYCR